MANVATTAKFLASRKVTPYFKKVKYKRDRALIREINEKIKARRVAAKAARESK